MLQLLELTVTRSRGARAISREQDPFLLRTLSRASKSLPKPALRTRRRLRGFGVQGVGFRDDARGGGGIEGGSGGTHGI